MHREKLYDAILGLATADAVGVPAEFINREVLSRKPFTDMVGDCGIWNKPKGTWSDDTAMTLATIDALNSNDWSIEEHTLHDIMINFINWYKHSEFTADGERFDIGNTCREAIGNYMKTKSLDCGPKNEWSCGNGALMRIAPLAFTNAVTMHDVINHVANITKLTHGNDKCIATNIIYVTYLKLLLSGADKSLAYEKISTKFKPMEILMENLVGINSNEISSSGYCVNTLNAALWSFLNTDNYRDCILTAVNLGDDTDTTAAVAGALAGVYYGIEGIPTDWLNSLLNKDLIKKLCNGGTLYD